MYGLLAVLAAFGVLGFLIYEEIEFGRAILIAVGVLLLLSKPSLAGLHWIYDISLEYETIRLVLIIVQIGFLGFLYKDSDQVKRMIKELRGLVPDRRWVVASIPAIFGLLPMPGGALVSAPMIDGEGKALKADGVQRTFINWWFRHVWFTVYPLSLGLILASTISGIGLYKIALFNLPIFIVHLAIGAYWLYKKIDAKPTKGVDIDPSSLVWELLPIILALGLNIFFGIPLYITLVVAILILLIQNQERYPFKKAPSLFKEGFSLDLLLASYGIMLFKGIIERGNPISPAVASLQAYVPLLAVVIVVAVAIGLLFGHLPGAVGVGFPVLLSLLPVVNVQTVGMIFLFIFMGYFVSPIHLCIILTIEYFGVELREFYRKMIFPFTLLALAIIVWVGVNGSYFFF